MTRGHVSMANMDHLYVSSSLFDNYMNIDNDKT